MTEDILSSAAPVSPDTISRETTAASLDILHSEPTASLDIVPSVPQASLDITVSLASPRVLPVSPRRVHFKLNSVSSFHFGTLYSMTKKQPIAPLSSS